MKPLPLPLRVAAGLAATAVEQAKDLPTKIAGFPVTVASQALQMSMRVQQHVTELAIKGDETLSGLRPVEENPSWATFDEDLDDAEYDVSRSGTVNGSRPSRFSQTSEPESWEHSAGNGSSEPDPWALEERALVEETAAADIEADDRAEIEDAAATVSDGVDFGDGEPAVDGGRDGDGGRAAPEWLANYDELSLPQLRARLRTFTPEQLEELLDHERSNADRPSFVGMLTRRIATVRDQA
ncbi:hypothetical protein EV193_101267 [Herbihabitans rhizosphaerae]|uniref:Lipid droplet-associated protein n=1 Tax=Herbihabitans rhizosphaerae TaxID=1872711 RepID=A0A4Q7L6Z8_9PSEU|nr:lipid droplet-associated protein [Herbihabitans rhizosphaerae]RZS44391.1 hypothetical protein EV193_101267 [Herbihabitans rhizosphaerae]